MLAIDTYNNAIIAGAALLLLAGTIVLVIGLLLRSARNPEASPADVSRHPRRRWIVATGCVMLCLSLAMMAAGSFHETSTDASSSPASSTTTYRPSSPKIAPPEPLAALNIGDCVSIGGTTGLPIPGDCNSLTTNYRLVQKMTSKERCTDILVKTEFTRSNAAGVVTVPTLCFAFDWRAGMCYDRTNIEEPNKVDCSTTGPNIVHVTAVFTDTLSDDNCPRDENGYRATTWDKRRLVVCMLNPPN